MGITLLKTRRKPPQFIGSGKARFLIDFSPLKSVAGFGFGFNRKKWATIERFCAIL